MARVLTQSFELKKKERKKIGCSVENELIEKELKSKAILNAHLSWLKNQASKQTDLVYVVSLCIMACLERDQEQGLPNKATSVFCFLETFLKCVLGRCGRSWNNYYHRYSFATWDCELTSSLEECLG